MKKKKGRVIEQDRRPIAKKIKEIVKEMSLKENWVVEVEIENKKRKTKKYRNMGIDRYLLKIKEDCPYEQCLKIGQKCLFQALR